MAQVQAEIPPYVREYETIYILKPEFEDPQVLELVEKLRALVAREGGKTIKISNWGKKKLAYEINGQQKGVYIHHQFVGQGSVQAELDRNLRLMDAVILHQSVVLNKKVLADQRQVEEDQLLAPVKEARRERERPDDEEAGPEVRRERDDDDDNSEN